MILYPDDSDASQWMVVKVHLDQEGSFGFAIQSRANPLTPPVTVQRYVLFPAEGVPLDYRDARTGEALLPRFAVPARLVPVGSPLPDDPCEPPEVLTWMGVTLHRDSTWTNPPGLRLDDVRQLTLDTHHLVATSREFTDDGTGRTGESLRTGEADYRWVELDPPAYAEMIEAGMNQFRVSTSSLDWFLDKPVLIVNWDSLGKRRDLLWRSNYLGPVMYMDEPAHRFLSAERARKVHRAEAAALLLIEETRSVFEGDSGYGQRFLQRMLTKYGYSIDSLEVLQPDYPVWEAALDGVWYDAEAGCGGICFQARVQPAEFAELVERVLGVGFPSDVESSIRFHLAFLRGASRWFSIPWGVGVYGQMDPEASSRILPMARERGAKYLWFWTSDGPHHVERRRQLELSQALQPAQDSREPPAEGPIEAVAAVVVPWGYTVAHYTLDPVPGRDPALWRSEHLRLQDRNDQGVTYGDVVATFYRTAAKLLREGVEFDVLHLRSEEDPQGYERVFRIGEDGVMKES